VSAFATSTATTIAVARWAVEAATFRTATTFEAWATSHWRTHGHPLTHVVRQGREFFEAERAVFVLVEAIEESLWIRRSRRPSVRSTTAEAFGAATLRATTFTATRTTRATITIVRSTRSTAATAFGTTTFTTRRAIGATAPFRSAISRRADVEVFTHRPANGAGFFVIESAVFVGVEIVE
jgi:hypothetical protein